MTKERRTKEQLTAAIISEANASGKCSDLARVIIIGPVRRGHSNWDITTMSTRPPNLLSDACRNELAMIVGRLQAKYDLGKEQKSAAELEQMVADRLGIGGLFVKVYADPAYGWRATAMTAPAKAIAIVPAVEQAADELRQQYDLKT